MAINENNMRLSGGCIGLLTDIGRAVYQVALQKAVQRAAHNDRSVVEEDDVRACIKEALDDVVEQEVWRTPDEACKGIKIEAYFGRKGRICREVYGAIL